MVLVIFPLCGCLPEIEVRNEDVAVIDGQHLVAGNFYGRFSHDEAAKVLNHGPVGVGAVQRNCEGQPLGPEDNHIVFAKVGETDQQLLARPNSTRDVGDDHGLPHTLDAQGLAEAPIWIKLASELAGSHRSF